MADREKISNNKHHCEGNHNLDHQKRPKSDENEGSEVATETEAEAEANSITGMCYEILEQIFDSLDLESLFNVAVTSKRLQIAAAAKFGDDHGDKHIWMFNQSGLPLGISKDVSKDQIIVYGLKYCLPFLRCFGAKILSLEVDYIDTANDYLDRYLNQYCANSLTNIKFWYKRAFSLENFAKPFKCVEKVEIGFCNLENQLPNFVNWFPELRHLKIFSARISDCVSAVSFLHPKDLVISNFFQNDIAANLLHANPQLHSLELIPNTIIALNDLLDMLSASPSIVMLQVRSKIEDVSEVTWNRFVAEHPLMQELVLLKTQFTADRAIMLVRQLNSLKRFEFRVKNRSECDRLVGLLYNEWQHNVRILRHDIEIILN